MAYNNLKSSVQTAIYQNSNKAITGSVLQSVLLSVISSVGDNSMFMGILTDSNKPSTIQEGKQFYIGYNGSSTALNVDLTAVGLGTLSITRRKIYIVYCDGTAWSAVNIASGLSSVMSDLSTDITNVSDSVPTNVNQLTGYDDLQHNEALEKMSGDVSISELASNTTYYLSDCTGLVVADYEYDETDLLAIMNLPETHIVIDTVRNDFDVRVPSTYLLRNGDSLKLLQGDTYLITVKGIFWKVDKYA